jgi:hypothetical protein
MLNKKLTTKRTKDNKQGVMYASSYTTVTSSEHSTYAQERKSWSCVDITMEETYLFL